MPNTVERVITITIIITIIIVLTKIIKKMWVNGKSKEIQISTSFQGPSNKGQGIYVEKLKITVSLQTGILWDMYKVIS